MYQTIIRNVRIRAKGKGTTDHGFFHLRYARQGWNEGWTHVLVSGNDRTVMVAEKGDDRRGHNAQVVEGYS